MANPIIRNPNDLEVDLNQDFMENYKTLVNETFSEFMNRYVPFREDNTRIGALCKRVGGAFDDVPKAKDTSELYTSFIKGLNRIAALFRSQERMAFADMNQSYLGICVGSTFPGRGLPGKLTWESASLLWELNGSEDDDPIDGFRECKRTEATYNRRTIHRAQLCSLAFNLFRVHRSCFIYVVGIYGPTMRVYRFDRCGIVISSSFNYVQHPELVFHFLWRVVHPPSGQQHAITGGDPTISLPNYDEFERAFERLLIKQPDLVSAKEEIRKYALWVTADIDDDDHPESAVNTKFSTASWEYDLRPYRQRAVKLFVFRNVYSLVELFGKATEVFKALLLDEDPSRDRICVLKDSWQQCSKWNEDYLHTRIKRHAANPLVREQLKNSALQLDLDKPGEASRTGFVENLGSHDLRYHSKAEEFGFVTQSARLRAEENQTDPASDDYSRVRIVMGSVGRRLNTYNKTQELIRGVRDVIRGLEFMRICGVIHRDVSEANILFHADTELSSGFLHDLDCSSPYPSILDPDPEAFMKDLDRELHRRVGTAHFMAMEITKKRKSLPPHAPHHDLESVFWVLISMIIRHMDCECDGWDERPTHSSYFPSGYHVLQAVKETRLGVWDRLIVKDNWPLTNLIEKLAKVFQSHSFVRRDMARERGVIAPYADAGILLKLMDEALEAPGWPENDWSIPNASDSGHVSTSIQPTSDERTCHSSTPASSQHDRNVSAEFDQEPPKGEKRKRSASDEDSGAPKKVKKVVRVHEEVEEKENRRPSEQAEEEKDEPAKVGWKGRDESRSQALRPSSTTAANLYLL